MTHAQLSKELRNTYKIVLWLLLSNNIAGTALNPMIFVASLVFVIGIPGAILLIHYLFASLRKEPVMLIVPHVGAIGYNVVIWLMLRDAGLNDIIGGEIWPAINVILSSVALIPAGFNFYNSQKNVYENS